MTCLLLTACSHSPRQMMLPSCVVLCFSRAELITDNHQICRDDRPAQGREGRHDVP